MSKIGANYKDALKCPFFSKNYIFSQPIKPILFYLNNKYIYNFYFIKVVSSSSKNTNNPLLVYIKYNVNNNLYNFSFPFLCFFFYFYF